MDSIFEDIIIAHTINGDLVLIHAPEKFIEAAGDVTTFMEDFLNPDDLSSYPTEVGVYKVTVEGWFEQGYFEGYAHNGESEWGWKCIKSIPLVIPEEVAQNICPNGSTL